MLEPACIAFEANEFVYGAGSVKLVPDGALTGEMRFHRGDESTLKYANSDFSAACQKKFEGRAMHHLHLLRHAKSVRDETSDDRERPLNRRGRDASRRIGESLQGKIGKVDLVLCSSTRRTRDTAELVLAGLKPLPRILYEDELYL